MGQFSEAATDGVESVNEAHQYAEDVLAGTIPACKWVKAACRRQLDDLARWESDPAWPYAWRPDLADHVIRFLELTPHVKDGKFWRAGDPIKLVPAQKFGIACVFGWVRKDDGSRRFRTVYEELPKKNAKSTKLAGIGLYCLVADDEEGAEVYSAATSEDQAKIVFGVAKEMARRSPEFRARFGVTMFQKALAVDSTASLFKPLSADADTLEGKNPSHSLIDELHVHKTRAVYDSLDTARGSRRQPLLWSITTAGSNRSGVCYDVRSYLVKILNAVLLRHSGLGYEVKGEYADDETFWGIIYTIDEKDDPFSEASWAKANPLYGVSIDPEDMRRMAQVATTQVQAQNAFFTKRLNIWVNADVSWMNMVAWDACGDRALKEERFARKQCVVALDAAFKQDLFAKVKVFRENGHYYAFSRSYTHRKLTEQKGNEHLAAWVKEGWLRATEGNILDIEAVRQELLGKKDETGKLLEPGDAQRFQIMECGYDPAQLTQFALEIQADGVVVVEIRPTVLNFSAAMKELEALITAGKFHHNGDPVLAWAISNVVCHYDQKDNIYPKKDDPSKKDRSKKIDPAIALLMCIARWLANPDGAGDINSWLNSKPVTA